MDNSFFFKITSVRLYFLIFLVFGIGHQTRSQNQELDIAYNLWDNLLQKHVNDDGFVDYLGFKKDKITLDKVASLFSDSPPAKDWNRNKKKAYLINVYNVFTIKLILKNYPLESIKNIGDKPFKAFKIKFIELGGELFSLDDIEKNMLIPLGDPKVHFAINCASFSCPRLYNKAYRPENLNQLLDNATNRFINSDLNIIKENQIKLSRVFDWYQADFENGNEGLREFINKYSKNKIKRGANIEYLNYDWRLNSI